MRFKSRFAKGCCCSLAVAAFLSVASLAQGQLVISAISGNGGGSAAAPNGDFVEIFNSSCATVDLDAYSVQVASSTGTAWSIVNLPAFNLVPGQYYAIRLQTTATGINYTADLTNPTAITIMTATSGKGAIVLGNTALVGACPTADTNLIDFVRFQADAAGTVSCTEGLVANATGITAASGGGEQRVNNCADTNVNRNDFAVVAGLLPRNSTNALEVCNPPISPNYGACSNLPPDDICLALTEAQCDTAGGVYAGDCTSCPLPGACCQPNGTCALMQQAACEALGLGAVYQGDPSCPPATPCAESGKCCSEDGTTCTQLVQVACIAPNVWSPGNCAITYNVNTDCPPNFTDISQSGTELLGWTSVDDSAITVALPFTFKFYGVDRTSASVGTNGYLVFNPPAGAASSIPPDAPLSLLQQNNSVYVYGEDLQLRGTGADPIGSVKHETFGTAPNQIFIVQWTNVDLFSPTQPDGQRNTFQVKLYEASGVVEMQYLSLNLTGLSPIPNDVVIGVRETNANFTEVSQSVVGTGPKALIFAPTGGCSAFLEDGSCCIPNQPCSVQTQAACQLACGVYQGDGTNCTSAPCVTEACCLPQGGCQEVLIAVCAQLNGVAQGPGSNCAGVNCPPAGRCCTAAGACSVALQANCQAPGSTWVQGEDCTTLPCVLGACCAADGTCSQLTEAGCTNANGIRWTVATPCTPNLCQGRCCAPDGSCSLTAFNACIAPSTYGGDGSTCTGTPCQGSCCNQVTGECTLTGPGGCVGANEVFGGLESTCASANCSGRCCQSNGSCSTSGSAGCAGGTYSAGLDCTSTTVVTFDNIGLVIPEGPGGATVTNIQVVAGLPTPLTDVDVDFKIDHTFFADLIISVEHNGTVVALTDGTAACFGDNPDVVLDDEGTGGAMDTIACGATVPPSPPNYTPIAALSAFDGMDPNGPWTISIRDDANLDTGTLRRWSLHVTTNAPVCPVVGCTCRGDTNGDAVVNGKDVKLFAQCVASGGAGCPCADMNNSGSATSADVPAFVTAVITGNCGP